MCSILNCPDARDGPGFDTQPRCRREVDVDTHHGRLGEVLAGRRADDLRSDQGHSQS